MQTKVIKQVKIGVRGVVQGVGFRPFIYRLAHKHNLKGWVRNTSGKVEIEIEGDEESLETFLTELKQEAPSAAHIENIQVDFSFPSKYSHFKIKDSLRQEGKH
ncbi:acylphosphatase, partial [Chloroflexota bacterium]